MNWVFTPTLCVLLFTWWISLWEKTLWHLYLLVDFQEWWAFILQLSLLKLSLYFFSKLRSLNLSLWSLWSRRTTRIFGSCSCFDVRSAVWFCVWFEYNRACIVCTCSCINRSWIRLSKLNRAWTNHELDWSNWINHESN